MRPLLLTRLGPVGARVPLGEALHHARHVLRLRDGEPVQVTDGSGRSAEARVIGDEVEILAYKQVEPWSAEVVLGLPRGPLVEEALTLGTEAGVSVFHLVHVERTPPGKLREDRLSRVVDAAVTQCGRASRPALRVWGGLAPLFAATPGPDGGIGLGAGRRVFGQPGAPALVAAAGPMVGAIGPEGGFTADEAAMLMANGFDGVGLGPHVLRAPSAVLVMFGRGWGG